MSFGKDLQLEREARGVSLEAIAEGTKVSPRHLRALEDDDRANMPGGVFNRGMVRSYCIYLGLPEEEWLTRWSSVSGPDASADYAEFAENVKRNRPQRERGMRARWWGVLLMLIALGALGWAAWHYIIRPRMRGVDTSLPVSATSSSSPK